MTNREKTESTRNRPVNTRREATHNHWRANLREAEIGRNEATWKQTNDNHGAVPHKTERLERGLLTVCSGSCARTNRKVWQVRNLTEKRGTRVQKCRGCFGGRRQASSERSGLHLTKKPHNIALEIRPKKKLETLRIGKQRNTQARDKQTGSTHATMEPITRPRQLMKEHPSKSSGPPPT